MKNGGDTSEGRKQEKKRDCRAGKKGRYRNGKERQIWKRRK